MINDVLMRLGSWDIALVDLPEELRNQLEFFGHVAFIPGDVDVRQFGDELLDAARYVGVVRDSQFNDDVTALGGTGLAVWLGDEDGKGHLIEDISFSGSSFANTIRALLPPTVQEGTLHSVSGTYTGKHKYQSPREAINYVTDTFNAEWRINNDGTFDAGTAAQLFATGQGIIVRKDAADDVNIKASQGDVTTMRDAQDYTTDVVLLAEGEGDAIVTGRSSVDPSEIQYRDLHGNLVKFTRIISESETATGNAQARAVLALNRFRNVRNSLTLSTDEYDFQGTFKPGDTVYIYDPEAGLIGDHQIEFRGTLLPCTTLRVVGVNFPVREGFTIAYRDRDGEWIDLTPYAQYETGQVEVTVGAMPRSLAAADEPFTGRVNAPTPPDIDDGTVPDKVDLVTPFDTFSYVNGEGHTRALIEVAWEFPQNTDGSTFIDGAYFEVRWRRYQGGWSNTAVGIDQTDVTIMGLESGGTYEIQVRAVDVWGNAGEWSDIELMVAQEDDIPPSTPAAPSTVAGNPLRIQVTHTLGKADGGTYNLEPDMDHFEVHLGSTSDFIVDEDTLLGTISANIGNLKQQVPARGSFDAPDDDERFVKVIAVDRAGNKSPASTAAAVTAELIQSQHVEEISADLISAGTIDASEINVINLDADQITVGTMHGNRIDDSTIPTIKLTPTLQSDNFVAGTSGWRIRRDTGDVEFASGVFRGDVIIGSKEASEYINDELAPIDTKATNAESTANNAESTATSAQSTANSAQSTANSAWNYADTAYNTGLASRQPANWSAGSIASGINIRSWNFNTGNPQGSAGWGIYGNGDVYFNNGYFKGTIDASTISGSTFQTNTSGARVVLTAGSDGLTFWSSQGWTTTLRQGNQDGLETSGSIRVGGASGTSTVYAGAYIGGGGYTGTSSGARGITINNVGRIDTDNVVSCTVIAAREHTTVSGQTANTWINPTGGQIHRMSSSGTTKQQIEDVDPAKNRVLELRPRWYRSTNPIERPDEWSYWGLIAEEVYDIDPRLAACDLETGEPVGVAYDRVGVLLQPYVKAHEEKIAELEAENDDLRSQVDALAARLDSAGL